MKIKLLGTGTSQGVPVIACPCSVCKSTDSRDKRLRSSILIQSATTNIVVDTGPDFRQQMLREDLRTLDAVVFTHEHKDHTAGLDDVRAFNYFMDREMDVYAVERVQDALKREFSYIFADLNYPGIPRLRLNPILNHPFSINDIELIPIEVMHYKLPVMAFRIGDFSYITDANYIAPNELDKVRGSKVIVLNALRKEKHISHFTLDEAIELLTELKPERAYLTHISHQLGTHEEIDRELPDFIRCGYDGMEIQF